VYNYRDQRFHKHLGEGFWIGANDIDIEDDWVWESDKSKLLFSDWHEGEPNNDDEECGNMRWDNSQYKWFLLRHSFYAQPRFICISPFSLLWHLIYVNNSTLCVQL
jgi:hypothetical protein